MTNYDSPWKEALDNYFQPFMQLCFSELAEQIDWSVEPMMLDKELIDADHAAKNLGLGLWTNWSKSSSCRGDVGWLLVRLEVQSQRDAEFTRCMFTYFYRIRDKYNKQVVSLAVRGDGEPNWRPDHYREAAFGCRFEFQFPVVKPLLVAKNRRNRRASLRDSGGSAAFVARCSVDLTTFVSTPALTLHCVPER